MQWAKKAKSDAEREAFLENGGSLVASRYEIRAAAKRATPSLILVGFCALKLADRSDPITE